MKHSTRKEKTTIDKQRVKIVSRVVDAVKLNFPETAQIIEECLEQECSRDNISVDEVIFRFTSVETKH